MLICPWTPSGTCRSPYIAPKDDHGEYELGVVAPERIEHCVEHNLCQVCGKSLSGTVALVAPDWESDENAFTEAPMHVECAESALALCPHLARRSFHGSHGMAKAESGYTIVVTARWVAEGPCCHDGEPRRHWLLTGEPLQVRRFDYGGDGKLAEVDAATMGARQR